MKRSCIVLFGAVLLSASMLYGQICPSMNTKSDAAFQSAGQLVYGMNGGVRPDPHAADSLKTALHGKKSPIGILMSLIVPGAGEFYAGTWWKGIIFTGVEAGLWTGYALWSKDGQRIEDEFHLFADQHWSEARYWVSVAQAAGIAGVTEENYETYLDQLRDAEDDVSYFTHSLPETKTQQYYEMIGKYDQFKAGWDDYSPDGPALTPRRDDYETMRDDCNTQFKRGSYCVMATLLNRVLSGLDTAWTIKKINRRVEAGVRVGLQNTSVELIPCFGMQLSW